MAKGFTRFIVTAHTGFSLGEGESVELTTDEQFARRVDQLDAVKGAKGVFLVLSRTEFKRGEVIGLLADRVSKANLETVEDQANPRADLIEEGRRPDGRSQDGIDATPRNPDSDPSEQTGVDATPRNLGRPNDGGEGDAPGQDQA